MANELRSRTNLVAGALSAGLSTSDTTMASAGLADLAVIDATNHAAISIFAADGNGRILVKEIVYVTAHTAGATTATILRGQEGTSAQTWASGATWAHTATTKDFDGAGGGSGLIGFTRYRHPSVDTIQTTTSTSFVDVDAANLTLNFTAPPSGKVLVVLTGPTRTSSASMSVRWNLRDSGGDIAGTDVLVTVNTEAHLCTSKMLTTGLTPGNAYSWKWGWRASAAGTASLFHGPLYGAVAMEVWAVNL